MVRVPAQQPKMTSRIKCFVWNWLRKYAKVHEGNDVGSTPPASTIFTSNMHTESVAASEPCRSTVLTTVRFCQLRHCESCDVSLSFACFQAYETSTYHCYRNRAIDGIWEASTRIRGKSSAADPGTENTASRRRQG